MTTPRRDESAAEIVPPDEASTKGIDPPTVVKERAAHRLARLIFIGAGAITVILIGAATATILTIGTENATSLLAFFGSIVSALGTLLGGIIGYYFGKSSDADT